MVVFIAALASGSSTLTDVLDYRDNPYCLSAVLPPAGSGKTNTTLVKTLSTAKLEGMSPAAILAADEFRGTSTANPSHKWIW